MHNKEEDNTEAITRAIEARLAETGIARKYHGEKCRFMLGERSLPVLHCGLVVVSQGSERSVDWRWAVSKTVDETIDQLKDEAINDSCKKLSLSDYVEVLGEIESYVQTCLEAARADVARKNRRGSFVHRRHRSSERRACTAPRRG